MKRRHGHSRHAQSRVISREGDDVVSADGGVVFTPLEGGGQGVVVRAVEEVDGVVGLVLQGVEEGLAQPGDGGGEPVGAVQGHLEEGEKRDTS